ncbi:uncharacterized protein LOC108660305 [Drosophila navojoa]|uniref:uncharacterized protein LOC108660305 n=1 Tax=Drosophila navojoa TaxID=7232 RepID=UPI000847BC41|nr:uncharacterized protein LOC108660305 [Drosophila navojoa]
MNFNCGTCSYVARVRRTARSRCRSRSRSRRQSLSCCQCLLITHALINRATRKFKLRRPYITHNKLSPQSAIAFVNECRMQEALAADEGLMQRLLMSHTARTSVQSNGKQQQQTRRLPAAIAVALDAKRHPGRAPMATAKATTAATTTVTTTTTAIMMTIMTTTSRCDLANGI